MANLKTWKVAVNNEVLVNDVEKNTPSSSSANLDVSRGELKSVGGKLTCWETIISLGVEERGILPVPVEERTDGRFVNVFYIWFTMSINCLPYVTSSLQPYLNYLSNLV